MAIPTVTTTSEQMSRMRWILFWSFVIPFIFVVCGTLMVIFLGVGNPSPEERSTLFRFFMVEIGVAVVALFYSVFNLRSPNQAGHPAPLSDATPNEGALSMEKQSELAALRKQLHDVHESVYQIAHQLAREQPALEIIEQERSFIITKEGDCQCLERMRFRVLRGTHAMEFYWMTGDPPDISFDSLRLSVSAKNRQATYLPAHDGLGDKKFVVFLLPSVGEGEEEEIFVSWHWPRMWRKLFEGKVDRWEEKPQPIRSVKRMRISFKIYGLARVECKNIGEAGGQCGSYLIDRVPTAECTWEASDVSPGARILLQLKAG